MTRTQRRAAKASAVACFLAALAAPAGIDWLANGRVSTLDSPEGWFALVFFALPYALLAWLAARGRGAAAAPIGLIVVIGLDTVVRFSVAGEAHQGFAAVSLFLLPVYQVLGSVLVMVAGGLTVGVVKS